VVHELLHTSGWFERDRRAMPVVAAGSGGAAFTLPFRTKPRVWGAQGTREIWTTCNEDVAGSNPVGGSGKMDFRILGACPRRAPPV
jgi:hypothetical protein